MEGVRLRRQAILVVSGVAVGAMVTGGSFALADAGSPPTAGYVSMTAVKIANAVSVGAGKTISPLAMGGATTVPTNATAVRLTVTAHSTKPGTLEVFPAGDPTAAGATSFAIGSTSTTKTINETVGTKDQISFHNTSAAAAVVTASITGYSTQTTASNVAADGAAPGQVLAINGSGGVSWITPGKVTVNAGTGLTGGGAIALGGSATLNVDPTKVQSRISGTCEAGTAMSAVAQDGTVTCQQAGGSKTIAGAVSAAGTTLAGSGFTPALIGTGQYAIAFPAGTFTSTPVMTVSPFGETTAFVAAIVYNELLPGDGSALFAIRISSTVGAQTLNNNAFDFIVTQT